MIDEIFERKEEQTGIGVMLGTAFLITNCNTVRLRNLKFDVWYGDKEKKLSLFSFTFDS